MSGYLNSLWNKLPSSAHKSSSPPPTKQSSVTPESDTGDHTKQAQSEPASKIKSVIGNEITGQEELVSNTEQDHQDQADNTTATLEQDNVLEENIADPQADMSSKENELADTPIDDADGEEGGDEEVYAVESIKGHEFTPSGQLLFLVKWLGYDRPEDDSWEPEENLLGGAEELLEEYFRAIGGRPVAPAKKSHKKRPSSTPSSSVKKHASKSRKTSENGTAGSSRKSADLENESNEEVMKLPDGSWEDKLSILSVSRDDESQPLNFAVTWLETGETISLKSPLMRERAPFAIIDFYEKNLKFYGTD
ncbi:hypothetical protein V1512DRAFT_257055 [Lipomyces arxii]|uniref:uncharacterized protein n=1 Tax=Lipomyces arxii TaxID=56418 RepID=UPI0034CFD290